MDKSFKCHINGASFVNASCNLIRKSIASMEKSGVKWNVVNELFAIVATRNIEGYNDYIKEHIVNQKRNNPNYLIFVVIGTTLADLMIWVACLM